MLQLDNVAVWYGHRQALHNVNLEVAPGILVSLVGPNGAGKTSLLRAILGLVPYTGKISIDGRSPADAYRGIGYVPQRHEFAWDFPITIFDAVLSARSHLIGWLRSPSHHDREITRKALAQVHLSDLAQRPVGELSGGQRQRVLIARALVTQPRLLLLDEPFTGLDIPTQESLMDTISHLVSHNLSVVMSTHDLPQALSSSDRIALINKTVIGYGSAEDICSPKLWQETFNARKTSSIFATIQGSAA